MVLGSCRLSTHRHSLLGHPLPARELGLPHGRLTRPPTIMVGWDPVGVSMLRTRKSRLGLGALCAPGTTVSTRPQTFYGRRLPHPSGNVPTCPAPHSDPGSHRDEASSRVSD